jgi:hypothetical protein
MAPEKNSWGAPAADENEVVTIPEWQHEKFEPLRRTPHEAIINLPGKFAFFLLLFHLSLPI